MLNHCWKSKICKISSKCYYYAAGVDVNMKAYCVWKSKAEKGAKWKALREILCMQRVYEMNEMPL